MFCTKCGAALAAGAKFCGSCGQAVEADFASMQGSPGPLQAEPSAASIDAAELPWMASRARREDNGSTTPRPWLRYWAKLVDVWLWIIVLGFLCGVVFPRWSVETNESLVGFILLLCTVPIHALLLSVFGTTVGKALFNIKVTHKGQKLTFGQAVGREALVYVKGFGLGIPIVALFTQIAAFNDLKATGSSSWDRDNGNIVTHKDPSVAGVAGAVAILCIALAIMLIGTMAGQGY